VPDIVSTIPDDGVPVLGTHLYPLWNFGEFPLDPRDATRILLTVPTPVRDLAVHVTRIGGLFVELPDELYRPPAGFDPSDPDLHSRRVEFRFDMVRAINVLIAELCLIGPWSEPAAPLHIDQGFMNDGRAATWGGSGDYSDRTHGPARQLIGVGNLNEEPRPVTAAPLDQAAPLSLLRELLPISESLPTFIAGAYSSFPKESYAEAALNAWIAVEQTLNWLFEREYVSAASNAAHKERLRDGRTFSAAVVTEILRSIGTLGDDAYAIIQMARKVRNDLAHDAEIDEDGARTTIEALRAVVRIVCDGEAAEPFKIMRGWSAYVPGRLGKSPRPT